MADRYWVGGTGNWNDTTHWSGTSGGAGGLAAPTSVDDVFCDANSGTGTLTLSSSRACRSINFTGVPVGFIWDQTTTGVLAIGDASGGAFTATANMGLTTTGSAALNFISTSNNGGTGWGVTTAGKTMPGMTFNGAGGKWVLQDALTAPGVAVTVTSGGFFGNGQSIACGRFEVSSNTLTRTADITNCAVTAGSMTNGGWTVGDTKTNLTLVATGSTITLFGAANGLTFTDRTGASVYNNVVIDQDQSVNSKNFNPTGTTTFVNLTIKTTIAAKTHGPITFVNTPRVTGTLTLGGQSIQGVNRMLLKSVTVGTAQTFDVTGGAVVISGDVDFMDVSITGSPSWTNAGSAFVGDALGNGSLITTNRTTPATQTHTASAGGNWSDVTKWTSRVPLPQDDVVVDGSTTGTLTADMPRLGADLTFTGFVGTWSASSEVQVFGSLLLGSGMAVSAPILRLYGRGAHTVTSNAVTIVSSSGADRSLHFSGPVGTYTLLDALSFTQSGSSAGAIRVSGGNLDTNNQSVTSTGSGASGVCGVRLESGSLTLGTSTVTLIVTTGITVFSAAGGTLSAASSTIVVSNASAVTRTFAGGGNTYGTLTYTVANSPGPLVVTGDNTFGNLNIGSGRTLTLPTGAGTPTHVGTWNVNGVVNGYLSLPGVTGNFATAPDSAALSITSDIDLRAAMIIDAAMSNDGLVVGKWDDSGVGVSYYMRVDTSGFLRLFWSADGAAGVNKSSTVGAPLGSLVCIRVTLDVDNGAAGNNVKFWTKATTVATAHADMLDDTGWVQLGTTVTTAGVTSIADTSALLLIGARRNAGSQEFLKAKLYAVAVKNGIDGTLVFDADFATKPFGDNTFVESSANAATVTINGTLAQDGDGRVTLNSSSAGNAAYLGRTLADPQGNVWRFMRTAATPLVQEATYVDLPGVAGNYIWTEDSAALSITSDIDIRCKVALNDWTPAATMALVTKYGLSGQRSYQMFVNAAGTVTLQLSADGTATVGATSSVATGVTDGAVKWVRVTWRNSDNRVQFFLSDDGVAWTQLGSDESAALSGIFDSTAPIEIGTRTGGTSDLAAGNFYVVDIRNNVLDDGTGIVAQANFSRRADAVEAQYLSIKDSTAYGSSLWYAGNTSVNVSNNSGWIFTDQSNAASNFLVFFE